MISLLNGAVSINYWYLNLSGWVIMWSDGEDLSIENTSNPVDS